MQEENAKLREENERLRAAINEAVEYVGLHYFDWGSRAEHAFGVLSAALAASPASDATDWRRLAMDLYKAHGQPGLDSSSNALRAICDAVRREREREREKEGKAS